MRAPERKVELLDIETIEVHDRVREISEDGVNALAASLEKIGLRTPISVRYYQERPDFLPGETVDAQVLMTGAHRLEAARRLGWERIEAFVYFEGDRIDAQLWEIAENLHRAELTKLERDEQVARWIELTNIRQEADNSVEAFIASLPPDAPEGISSQVETKIERGRPEGGVNAAARELGLSKPDAHRAVKVASLSDEAKTFARQHGLDDNRSALLAAAKHETADAQVKALEDRQQGGIAGRYRATDDAPDPLPTFDDIGRALDVLLRLSPDDFNRICPPPKRAAMYQRLARLEQVFEQVREGVSQ